MGSWVDAGRVAGRRVLDQLFPPSCMVCGAAVSEPDGLCVGCWRQLVPISAPFCPVLGLPFVVDPGPGALSAQALAEPPPYGRARSAFVYSEMSGKLVSQLKYGDRPELARFAARAMLGAGKELLADNPVLVPVPLHGSRQWQRRYNQSSELARTMARLSGLDYSPLLVRRTQRTPPQVGLNTAQRRRNVAGAFGVDPAQAGQWAGRRIILIDDVITTGATIGALALGLKKAGFGQIDVISFARVVFGAELPI